MRSAVAAVLLIMAACAEPVANDPAPVASAPNPPTSVGRAVDVAYHCGPLDLGGDPERWLDLTAFEGEIELMIQEAARQEYEASRSWWESMEWRTASETATSILL